MEVALSSISIWYGLGMKGDENLAESLQMMATEYSMIWSFFYTTSLHMVKCAICITLLRLTKTMKYFRLSVFALLSITISSFLIVFVSTITICVPLDATWKPYLIQQGKASCQSGDARTGLLYVTTILTIVTDISCAILPALIVWRTQLELKTKLLVSLLLSFGSL